MAEEHYLLMRDTPGEKTPGTFKKMVGMTNTKRVLRGELLRPIPRNEMQPRPDGVQPNFSMERDPAVTLFAVEDDVTPLSPEDYPLLKAIESPFDRFRVFFDPQWLEWGANLNVNSQVYIRLPSPNASLFTWSAAVVRFKGPVKTLPGTTFGAEIMDPDHRGKGTSNGVFQNHRYFTCMNDCALFVSLDRLWFQPRSVGIQGELLSQQLQLASKQHSYAAVASPPSHQSQPSHSRKKTPPSVYPGSSEVDPPSTRFRINDPVVVFDKRNAPLHGHVRWIGRKNQMGHDMEELHVGVEMGVYVNLNDVPGAKTGLAGLFAAKKNHSIIIPESLVAAAKAYTSKRERASKDRKVQQETGGDPPPYLSNPVAIAREFKNLMTQPDFIEEQKKVLKEYEEQKRKKDELKVSRSTAEETLTAATPVQNEEHTKIERESMQQIEKMSQKIKELEVALQHRQKQSDSQVIQFQQDLQKEQKQRKESDSQVVQLQQDLQKEKESSAKLHQQLSEMKAENISLQNSQQESIAFGIEPWKVPRNKVELGSVIGGGGWGVVYEGKLQVAVKHFYPNIMSKQNLSRLKREMRMLALIRHPNLLQFIAAVFDEKEDHERKPPYIITELLDMSLRSAYEKSLLPNRSVLSIFQDTARALDYLHRRHEPIIHRDVSSANVLLKHQEGEKWIAKLSDLGSANLAKEAYTMNEGSRVYSAPEAFTSATIATNARSAGNLTPKVDVYSYGIVLCEVATSTFPDEQGQFPSMLARVRCEWPQLHQLIVDCTNQSPEQRPTMASVLASLESFPP